MKFWAEIGTPADFGHELLPDDLGRIEPNVLAPSPACRSSAHAGIKRVINGPMIWSPDSAALFGPVPELRNYFCCNGIIPGFSQSGGLGKLAAEWMVEGEPTLDMFAWDLARFGDWADARLHQGAGARRSIPTASRSTSPTRSALPAAPSACGRPMRCKRTWAPSSA